MKYLFNVSNHPSSQFTKVQKEHNAQEYDQVIDLGFPTIEKGHHEEDFLVLAKALVASAGTEIEIQLGRFKYPVDLYIDIMVCGEFGMTYLLINLFKELQKFYQKAKMNRVYIDIVYPSTPRIDTENSGKPVFEFYRYRRYM